MGGILTDFFPTLGYAEDDPNYPKLQASLIKLFARDSVRKAGFFLESDGQDFTANFVFRPTSPISREDRFYGSNPFVVMIVESEDGLETALVETKAHRSFAPVIWIVATTAESDFRHPFPQRITYPRDGSLHGLARGIVGFCLDIERTI